LTLFRLVNDSLDLELDPAHFEKVVLFDLVILTVLIISNNQELNNVKHTLFHLLGWQHGFAIFLVIVVYIFGEVCWLDALDEEAAATFLNTENFLVVGAVFALVVGFRISKVNIETLPDHHLILVGPQELLFGIGHFVVKQAM